MKIDLAIRFIISTFAVILALVVMIRPENIGRLPIVLGLSATAAFNAYLVLLWIKEYNTEAIKKV